MWCSLEELKGMQFQERWHEGWGTELQTLFSLQTSSTHAQVGIREGTKLRLASQYYFTCILSEYHHCPNLEIPPVLSPQSKSETPPLSTTRNERLHSIPSFWLRVHCLLVYYTAVKLYGPAALFSSDTSWLSINVTLFRVLSLMYK